MGIHRSQGQTADETMHASRAMQIPVQEMRWRYGTRKGTQMKSITRYTVRFGKSSEIFYTAHHVEQFTRALRMNGTPYTVSEEPASK
jgi:hypothetical protein